MKAYLSHTFSVYWHPLLITGIDELLVEYPHLTLQDIYAWIAYGAVMLRERFVEIPIEVAA